MQNMSGGGKTALGLDSNVAVLLCNILAPICCIGVILSIVVLVTEKTNSFVRFYAAQAICLWVALFIFNLIVGFAAGFALGMAGVPELARLVSLGLVAIAFGVFGYVGYMGYQGKMFEVPVIGGIAKSFSGS